MTIFVTSRKWFNRVEIDPFNRLEIDAFKSPGQPGREGDNMKKLEPIVYYDHRIEPIRIADGEYRGIPFYVLSLGTHPCAYVNIAQSGIMTIDPNDISCHGGVTYTSNRLATVEHEGTFIGWDYAHWGDYNGYLGATNGYASVDDKRWTTEEIVAECENVIDQILGKKILKPCPFCGGKSVEILEDENKYLYYRYIAQCQECGATAKPGRTKEEARKAWNRRADHG